MGNHSFEDLEVWRRGCELAVFVYQSTSETRDFGLRDQMRRSAVSIPSNIAEGYERAGKDFARFMVIAKGSAGELRTEAHIAARVGVITTDPMQHIVDESKQLGRML